MPVDPDPLYLSTKSGYCSQLLQIEARLPTVASLPFLTQTKDTDIVVEGWCIRCKEHTRNFGGGNKCVDILSKVEQWSRKASLRRTETAMSLLQKE